MTMLFLLGENQKTPYKEGRREVRWKSENACDAAIRIRNISGMTKALGIAAAALLSAASMSVRASAAGVGETDDPL